MDPTDEKEAMRQMLEVPRLAIVGLSDRPDRPSNMVAEYMQSHGKQILPVNPTVESVLGEKAWPDLTSIPDPPEVVVVFRRSSQCPEVVQQAVAAGVRGVWLQQGIRSPEARDIAEQSGLLYVEDRCYKIEMMYAGR